MNKDKEREEHALKYLDKFWEYRVNYHRSQVLNMLSDFAKIREEKAVESIRFKLRKTEEKYQHCSNENQLKSSLISDHILQEKQYLKEIQSLKAELKELREGIVKALNEKLDGYDKATDRYIERCAVFDCIKIVETFLTKTNQDESE